MPYQAPRGMAHGGGIVHIYMRFSVLFYLLLLFPGKLLKGNLKRFSASTKAVQLAYHKFLFNGIILSLFKPVSPRVMAP